METAPGSVRHEGLRAGWPFVAAGIAVYVVVPIVMFVGTNRQVSARAVGYASLAGLLICGYGFWKVLDEGLVATLLDYLGIPSANVNLTRAARLLLVCGVAWCMCAIAMRAVISALVWAYR